jgi:copper chaperone CopZ
VTRGLSTEHGPRVIATADHQRFDSATEQAACNATRRADVTSYEFHIQGMNSRRCVRLVSGSVSDVPGVRTVEVDLETETVRVTGTADVTDLQAAIRRVGYEPCVEES